MSVVLVCLPNAPKVSEEAVRKDAELNRYLESRVEGEKRSRSGSFHFNPFFVLFSFFLSLAVVMICKTLSDVPALP